MKIDVERYKYNTDYHVLVMGYGYTYSVRQAGGGRLGGAKAAGEPGEKGLSQSGIGDHRRGGGVWDSAALAGV